MDWRFASPITVETTVGAPYCLLIPLPHFAEPLSGTRSCQCIATGLTLTPFHARLKHFRISASDEAVFQARRSKVRRPSPSQRFFVFLYEGCGLSHTPLGCWRVFFPFSCNSRTDIPERWPTIRSSNESFPSPAFSLNFLRLTTNEVTEQLCSTGTESQRIGSRFLLPDS